MNSGVGICAYNIDGRELLDLAQAADECGFTSLWLGEHVVLPVRYEATQPTDGGRDDRPAVVIDAASKLLDPLVALAACAARTTSISLATGVYLLPLRSPLATARMVHTIHQLSGGRFEFGVGAGWLREEFDALGVPFEDRGTRLEEQLDIIELAFSGGPFGFDGSLYQFRDTQVCQEPIDVPIIMGGNSRIALERAARRADGWFASGTPTFEEACGVRDELMALRRSMNREGPFATTVRLTRPDAGDAERYVKAGFHGVLVWADQIWPTQGGYDDKREALGRWAQILGVTTAG